MSDMHTGNGAVLSACERYRYVLWREIPDQYGPPCVFVMLNPSTADASENDPTIRRCIGFARSWGCRRLYVINLFAYRATKPDGMKAARDPVGMKNKEWIDQIVEYATTNPDPDMPQGPIVCAWGNHGSYQAQDEQTLGWLDALGVDPVCLGITKDGHPKHPLYLKADTKPQPFGEFV